MTNEEAIKMIQGHKYPNPTEAWQMINNEAIDIAIKSLSAETVHRPDYSYEADMVRRLKEALQDRPIGEWIRVGHDMYPQAIDAAILSAEAVQGWIPCSERLPEKGEVVLITNGKGNVRCGQYRSEYDVRGGTHYWWWKGKTVESVIAWMPLPEPYKEV